MTTIPTTDDYIGAAPGGWIAVRSTHDGSGSHVVRYSTSGTVTDLGVPLAHDTRFDVTPGPSGVLVAAKRDDGRGSGLVRYRPYAASGSWRTLNAGGAGSDATCPTPTTRAVVCDIQAHAKAKHSGEVLLSLTGSRKVWMDDHAGVCQTTAFEAVGSAAVGRDTTDLGPCVRGRITRLSATGKATFSRLRLGPHASGLIPGFGRLLLDTNDLRRIVGIDATSLGGRVRTVAVAH